MERWTRIGTTTAEEPMPAQGEQAAYWLRRCQGFRVDSEERKIGIAEDVLYGAEHDRPGGRPASTSM